MYGTQFSKLQGEGHLIGRVQSCQNRMCRLQHGTHTGRILRRGGNCHDMPDGTAVTTIDRLIGLGFNQDINLGIIGQHLIDGRNQLSDLLHRVLTLCTEGPLPGQPQNHVLRTQGVRDIDGSLSPPHPWMGPVPPSAS